MNAHRRAVAKFAACVFAFAGLLAAAALALALPAVWVAPVTLVLASLLAVVLMLGMFNAYKEMDR